MNLSPYASVLEQKASFLKGVTDYMNFGGAEGPDDPTLDSEWAAGYGQDDVDAVSAVLDTYLTDLQEANGLQEQLRHVVEKVVLALNALNEQTEGNLIETDQREQLCEIIIEGAKVAGFESDEHDITEEWREW